MRHALIALIALGVMHGPLAAQESGNCVGFGIEDDAAATRLGVIEPEGRTNFVKNGSDDPSCPTDIEACLRRAFLVQGDRVVINREIDDYVCASFVNGQGVQTDGWLPAQAVDRDRRPGEWAGTWSRGDSAEIIITEDGGDLSVTGSATTGTGAATHVGSLEASGTPKKGVFAFAMGENGTLQPQQAGAFDCVATLALRGPYLVAQDNGNCGGANVRFTGIYTRQ